MKVDFRKVTTRALDGTIYQKTANLGELELARRIYLDGKVELTGEQADAVRRYVREGFKAFVQEGVERMLKNEELRI